MFHDALPLLPAGIVSQIEDLTDADRIDAFVMNHITDLCGKTIRSMPLFLGLSVPADIVKC
jgi:hypothetical protein